MVAKVKRGVLIACRVPMIVVMAFLLALPIAFMNHDHDVKSDIDNRKLTELPIGEKLSSDVLQDYVADRLGFRKEMIGAYSVMNDYLFGVMTHPGYEYGKDGYVFFKYTNVDYDEKFIDAYATYVLQMQEYCEARDTPFLYVISPEKKRTYADKMSDSINWQPSSSALLKPILDELGVDYIDLNDALVDARDAGSQVFNVAYDAGHWNAEGMYAGVRYIIDTLNKMGVNVEVIDLDDYTKVYEEHTELPASYYPIDAVTTYKYERLANGNEAHVPSGFSEVVEMNPHFKFLACYENTAFDDSPDLLMFQGSYFISQGTMLQNQFHHAYLVHDYQNVLNLPYYYDVFNPDVVIFECADYTLTGTYYSYDELSEAALPPAYSSWVELPSVERPYYGAGLKYDPYSVVNNCTILLPEQCEAAYVLIGERVLDMAIQDDMSAHLGVQTEELASNDTVELVCVTPDERQLHHYQVPLESVPSLHTKFLVSQFFKGAFPSSS